MRKKLLALAAAFLAAAGLSAQNAWINEIHYDNTGTDADEFIEVVIENPGSYTLSDFAVDLYNGNDGKTYSQKLLSEYTVGATSGSFTFYYLNYTAAGLSIQNGAPDGLCLSYQGTVIPAQFLSYEGTLTAVDGPASGMTSVDIGVSEVNSPVGQSLQLSGTGSQYAAFVWQPPATATMGQVNNGQVLGTYTPDPEPSAYPASFTATGQGLSALLTWVDATGTQLPAGYLIKASTSSAITQPVDGMPEADDEDLSDGKGAWNVTFGAQSHTWNGLAASTLYYFRIFPYTNYGQYIDYKTDGTAPAAEATTQAIVKFYNFDDGLEPWTQYSVMGDQIWVYDSIHGIDGSGCAKMSGYSSGNFDNEDWLISPAIDLTGTHEAMFRFFSGENYGDGSNPMVILLSTDYTSGNPSTSGTWIDVSQGITLSPGSWTWTPSEYIDLSSYDQPNVRIAFKYTSTTNDAPTWEVDDVLITASSGVGMEETPKDVAFEAYPNPCTEWFFLNVAEAGDYSFSLINPSGKTVINRQVQDGATRVDVKSLSPGLYILSVYNHQTGTFSTSRVVVR